MLGTRRTHGILDDADSRVIDSATPPMATISKQPFGLEICNEKLVMFLKMYLIINKSSYTLLVVWHLKICHQTCLPKSLHLPMKWEHFSSLNVQSPEKILLSFANIWIQCKRWIIDCVITTELRTCIVFMVKSKSGA